MINNVFFLSIMEQVTLLAVGVGARCSPCSALAHVTAHVLAQTLITDPRHRHASQMKESTVSQISENAQWDVSTNRGPFVTPFIPDSSFRAQRYVRHRQRHGLAFQTSLRRHRDERRHQLMVSSTAKYRDRTISTAGCSILICGRVSANAYIHIPVLCAQI